jgi:hypothetical membrane protein
MRLTLPIVAGLAAPLVYAATVAVFGNLTPGYSHVANAISELNLPNAPLRRAVDGAFVLYNLLLILFALSLRRNFVERGARVSPLAALFLFLTGLGGLAMTTLFTMDPVGSEPTFGGQMHLILAGALSVGTILSVYFFARSLRRRGEWPRLAGYSFFTLFVILVSGAFAAFAAWRGAPVVGLWERITIGAFLVWIWLLSLTLALTRPLDEGEEDFEGEEDPEDA